MDDLSTCLFTIVTSPVADLSDHLAHTDVSTITATDTVNDANAITEVVPTIIQKWHEDHILFPPTNRSTLNLIGKDTPFKFVNHAFFCHDHCGLYQCCSVSIQLSHLKD